MGQAVTDILAVGSLIPGPQQPFVAGASALLGGIAGQNAQNAASNAASGYAGSEAADARLLQKGNYIQPIVNAENLGVRTMQQQVGGVPNSGALAKELFGDNITAALNAAVGQRSNNLNSAAGIFGGLSSQAQGVAQGMGNPWTTALPGVSSAIGSIFKGGTTPGVGTTPDPGVPPITSGGPTPAGGLGL